MRANHNVVVDKPFTITVEQARHLAAVAKERKVLLSVFQNRDGTAISSPSRTRYRGIIGRIVLFESRNRSLSPGRPRPLAQVPVGCGRALRPRPASHRSDVLLFGIPDSVQASLAKQRRGAKTDDFFHLVLRYGEMVATLGAGSLVSGGSARFALHGDRASLIKQKADIQEDQLKARWCRAHKIGDSIRTSAVLYEGATAGTRALKAARGDQRGYYVALREALHGRSPHPVPAEQGATVMQSSRRRCAPRKRDAASSPISTNEERAAWRSDT